MKEEMKQSNIFSYLSNRSNDEEKQKRQKSGMNQCGSERQN